MDTGPTDTFASGFYASGRISESQAREDERVATLLNPISLSLSDEPVFHKQEDVLEDGIVDPTLSVLAEKVPCPQCSRLLKDSKSLRFVFNNGTSYILLSTLVVVILHASITRTLFFTSAMAITAIIGLASERILPAMSSRNTPPQFKIASHSSVLYVEVAMAVKIIYDATWSPARVILVIAWMYQSR
jgi:hypothetical protein